MTTLFIDKRNLQLKVDSEALIFTTAILLKSWGQSLSACLKEYVFMEIYSCQLPYWVD